MGGDLRRTDLSQRGSISNSRFEDAVGEKSYIGARILALVE